MICPNCKESYKLSKALIKNWELSDKGDVLGYRGRGCDHCKGAGFRGRTGLYELMIVDDEMKEMIISGVATVELKKKAHKAGMRFLGEDGRAKALKGMTTFEEVGRVCEERVGLKKEEPEDKKAERYVRPVQETGLKPEQVKPEVSVDSKDLAEYQTRIARWLGEKK